MVEKRYARVLWHSESRADHDISANNTNYKDSRKYICVLFLQLDELRKEHPVRDARLLFNAAKINYSAHEREELKVIFPSKISPTLNLIL